MRWEFDRHFVSKAPGGAYLNCRYVSARPCLAGSGYAGRIAVETGERSRSTSGRTRPGADGRGRHPIRVVEIWSAIAQWLLSGEWIAGCIALMRSEAVSRQRRPNERRTLIRKGAECHRTRTVGLAQNRVRNCIPHACVCTLKHHRRGTTQTDYDTDALLHSFKNDITTLTVDDLERIEQKGRDLLSRVMSETTKKGVFTSAHDLAA
ncbi:hypothetical protein SAMN05443245_7558 [Paraburkholderia fungorum]|uniref:Uncharacterized protein n=1 Tax=Paraburkholderia fungorum TaxID=134537 RepID=A0A1H1JZ09_9BURK|nr:hypothetical protein SAMN05443245_7558 [Paraburkholderia fungorum]